MDWERVLVLLKDIAPSVTPVAAAVFSSILVDYPDDHLIIVVLANREAAGPSIGRDLARAALQLPGKKLLDLPVAPAEAAALSGTFESDEGKFEQFVQDGKVHFRVPGQSGSDGVLYRQSDTVYALLDQDVFTLDRSTDGPDGIVSSFGVCLTMY